MHRSVVVLAVGWALLASPVRACEPRLERGWADVGGGTLRLVMDRDGEACGARIFASAVAPRPAEALALVVAPAHGRVGFSEGRFTYTPAPGFAGADRFELRGLGPNRSGTLLPLRGVVEVVVRDTLVAPQPAAAVPVATAAPANREMVAAPRPAAAPAATPPAMPPASETPPPAPIGVDKRQKRPPR